MCPMGAWKNELQVHKRLSVSVTNIAEMVNIPAAEVISEQKICPCASHRNSTDPCKFLWHRIHSRICSWVTQELNV